jgi:1-acyl-sn-glycerol-3-phosphate acyltransferase
VRRAWRATALLLAAAVLGSMQIVVLGLGPLARRWAMVLPQCFHRFSCAVLGLRLHVDGCASRAAQTIWVANHQSYLDICVLGALLPGRFVAKREVRGWPLLGLLSRLQGTVYIGRRPSDAGAALDAMARALGTGANLIVFPEGTTSDGRSVLPFRSAPFAALGAPGERDRVIQPVTIAVEPAPESGAAGPYAYHGNDVLVPHLGRFLARRRTDVRVTLHEPLPVDAFGGERKQAAKRLHAIVASAFPAATAAVP